MSELDFLSGLGGSLSEKGKQKSNVDKNNIVWGLVKSVNSEAQTMSVEIMKENPEIASDIPINTLFTNTGFGFRVMPIPNKTVAILYRLDHNKYFNLGFYSDNLQSFMSDRNGDKESESGALLQRYLENGEVQITSLSKNEIYLAEDGSVLLKAGYGASLKLDNNMHRLDGTFANMKYEMDGVRIRAGNIIRPVVESTNEDDFILFKMKKLLKKVHLIQM